MSALLLRTLDCIKARGPEFEARFGVRLIGVVGSVARSEERADSDIDLVYDVTGKPTLFDLIRAQMELERALGRSVDLVSREALKPERRAYLERDLVKA